MNTIHNNGENEKSLSEGLDELRQAYGQLEQDEPPELLDQAILNSAHRAVEKKSHWMKFGWLHGLTTAAVFVLAFSLILNQPEPVQLQREEAAKKQPSDIGPEISVMEMKSKSDKQQGFIQNIPVAAPLESAEKEAVPARSKLEEMVQDESDSMLDSVHNEATYKMASPATISEPAASEDLEARTRTDSEVEQRLLTIIKLKQSGDGSWKTELELFKEHYPHYPVPDELTD